MYFAHPIDFFAVLILQKLQIYHSWFLFGVTPGDDSYTPYFAVWNHKVSTWAVYKGPTETYLDPMKLRHFIPMFPLL